MKKFSRLVLIGLALILAVAVIVFLAVNLYVQSQATQARIQQELSQRLGTRLKIRRISVTPWSGLKLSGITIPQANSTVTTDFLEAKAFQLRIRFASLFSQRLVINEISLIRPTVVWQQNGEGKWRLPETEPEITETTSAAPLRVPPPAPLPSAAEQKTAPSATVPTAPATAAAESRPGFVPEIRRVSLKEGAFHFLDENGNVVANFVGVNFRSTLRNASALRGTITIATTSLRDRFFLEQLKSPLQYDPTVLEFSNVSAKADGGEITGSFSMRPQQEDSPFQAHIRFRGLQADRIVTEAGGPKGIVVGQLEGKLDGNGKTADPNALSGRGEIFLRNGQVQQYSLLVALGQILQIEELTQLHLDEAHVKYHLSPGLITIDELILHSPNIRLSATGTITFAGKMRLESQLALNEKILSRLFHPIRANFHATTESDFKAISFQITGSVDRPKTNLMDKLIGQDLKDLGSVLNSLLGGGKSGRQKTKQPDVASPAPLPSPTIEPGASPPPAAVSPTASAPSPSP